MMFHRYAVIGSNSFAGAAFVARAIANGAEVIGFSRSSEPARIFLPYMQLKESGRFTFYQANICYDLPNIINHIETFRPQVVVDFAGQGMVAESWQDPSQWYTTNIVAKVRFHDRLRRYDWLERYVRISTPEVYGNQDNMVKETCQYNPSTPYAVSHAAIDMSLRAFHQNYNFPVIFTRFANFYGPGQQLYRIVPRTIIYALSGRKLQLHGGGNAIRAFIHATDVSNGIMQVLKSGKVGEIYHFSPTSFLTIRQVVELICERMGISFDSLIEMAPDRPGKDRAYLMDSSRARSELGWVESISFEKGLDSTISWVKENWNEIKTMPLNYFHKS